MPTYRYQCKNCGHELEELQSMNEEPLLRCPECRSDNLARVMSGGAGLIFKGSGFYQTDYKKESASPPGEQGEKKETAGTGSEKKETPGEKTEKKQTPGEKKAKSKKEGGEKRSEKKDGS